MKRLRKASELSTMQRYGSLKETGTTCEQNVFSKDNRGQNILQKVKDSRKIRHFQKTLISPLANHFYRYCQGFISVEVSGNKSCPYAIPKS